MMKAEVVINGGAMLSSNNNEEGEKKMKKKEQEELLLPYLDENIITEILIRVPVESLFNSFRYVCKSWLNIITNHPSNLPLNRLRSQPPCLIIQLVDSQGNSHEKLRKEEEYTYTTSFIKMGKQGIEKQYDITPIFKKLRIRACCNGLILATPGHGRFNMSTLYVVNPLTNHQVMLPPHPPESAGLRYTKVEFMFISSKGEYWVLMEAICPSHEISWPPKRVKRYIQILKLSAEDFCGASSSPPNDDIDLPRRQWRTIEVQEPLGRHHKYITIDVHTEKLSEFAHSGYHGHKERSRGFMKMGGFLASWVLGHLHQYDDALTLSVCVLKDLHTGEWIHQYSVRIDPDFFSDCDFNFPVLSSGNGEVIIFLKYADETLWAYNVESHRRWEVKTNLKKWNDLRFYDFHVENDATQTNDHLRKGFFIQKC